ncbi:transposase [Pseudochrobactrum algeriensis]|uniref:transposase n=1 Tax=Pseudochrobactrum saccharolyticum TaxID=354352 RepID=UPI0009F8EC44|nr:transposase [Ochrobactrum sp. GRS2]MBX8814211.1 transposase [Ochrobactrum sp. MR34]MDP8250095.1 transposase [Pseudochrobactrum saccharolyticum]QVQ38484.1 transposase [Pseudochrobactrum algeriensis]QVQ41699.1 transposase [Pseudochrobactrum algeriensis]
MDAVKQITERGYSVADVSRRLGVSTHSLYSWMKHYNAPEKAAAQDDQLSEIRSGLAVQTELRD